MTVRTIFPQAKNRGGAVKVVPSIGSFNAKVPNLPIVRNAKYFQSVAWATGSVNWFKPILSTNTLTSFQEAADSSPGVTFVHLQADASWQVLTTNSNPVVNVVDGSTITTTHCPTSLVIASNNSITGIAANRPLTVLNTTTGAAISVNQATVTSGGAINGFVSIGSPTTSGWSHGGSGTLGGEISSGDIASGVIDHALAIELCGYKYYNRATPFVAPANWQDGNYNVSNDPDYYNGSITTSQMGTRYAIPKSTSLTSLIATPDKYQTMFYNALINYGAYTIDGSAGNPGSSDTSTDYANVCCTWDIAYWLFSYQSTFVTLFTALQIVS